jgi:hypothetical protein
MSAVGANSGRRYEDIQLAILLMKPDGRSAEKPGQAT